MNFESLLVAQAHVSSVNLRRVVDLSKYDGPCLHHAYYSANLFPLGEADVAMVLGVSVLDYVAQYKLPSSAIMSNLGDLVYFALTHLAADIANWRWSGDPAEADSFHCWLMDGTLVERQRRVRNLLGIAERRASRFVLLNCDLKLVATNDITEALTAVEGAPPIVFDAVRLANHLDQMLTGALFICQRGGGK